MVPVCVTGTVFAQLDSAPTAVLLVSTLIALGSLVPLAKARSAPHLALSVVTNASACLRELVAEHRAPVPAGVQGSAGNVVGPFTPNVEMWNGRFAMVRIADACRKCHCYDVSAALTRPPVKWGAARVNASTKHCSALRRRSLWRWQLGVLIMLIVEGVSGVKAF